MRVYENEITWQATVGQRSLREVTSIGGLQPANHNVTTRYWGSWPSSFGLFKHQGPDEWPSTTMFLEGTIG